MASLESAEGELRSGMVEVQTERGVVGRGVDHRLGGRLVVAFGQPYRSRAALSRGEAPGMALLLGCTSNPLGHVRGRGEVAVTNERLDEVWRHRKHARIVHVFLLRVLPDA